MGLPGEGEAVAIKEKKNPADDPKGKGRAGPKAGKPSDALRLSVGIALKVHGAKVDAGDQQVQANNQQQPGQAAAALPGLIRLQRQKDVFQSLPSALRTKLRTILDDHDDALEDENRFFEKYPSIQAILTDKTLKAGQPQPGETGESYRVTVLAELKDHLEAIQDRYEGALGAITFEDDKAGWSGLAGQALDSLTKDEDDSDAVSAQKALLEARLLAEQIKDHVPEQIAARVSDRQTVRIEDIARDPADQKKQLKKLLDGYLETPGKRATAKMAVEAEIFEEIVKRHGGKDATHFDVFADRLLHPPEADERMRLYKAADDAADRARRVLDLGGSTQDSERMLEHIPRAFWPPEFIHEVQAYRKVERAMLEERVAALTEKGIKLPGKLETTEDTLNFIKQFFDDTMTFLNGGDEDGWANVTGDVWETSEWLNYGIGDASALIAIGKDTATMFDADAGAETRVLAAAHIAQNLMDIGRNVSNCSEEMIAAMGDAAFAGIASEVMSVGFDAKDLWDSVKLRTVNARQMKQLANLKLRGEFDDSGERTVDVAYEQALRNEDHARAIQQAKLGVDMAAHSISAVGYGLDPSGFGTPVKLGGKVIEYAGRIVFAQIDYNDIKKARKTIEEARAGSVAAQYQVVSNSALYAKSYIAILAMEEDPKAVEFIVQRGYEEEDLERPEVSMMVVAEFLMDSAGQQNEMEASGSRLGHTADSLSDGLGGKLVGKVEGKFRKRRDKKIEARWEERRAYKPTALKWSKDKLTFDPADWKTLVEKMDAAKVYDDPATKVIGERLKDVQDKKKQLNDAKSSGLDDAFNAKYQIALRQSLEALTDALFRFNPLTTPDNPNPKFELSPVPHPSATQMVAAFGEKVRVQIDTLEDEMTAAGVLNLAWEPVAGTAADFQALEEARRKLEMSRTLKRTEVDAERKIIDEKLDDLFAKFPMTGKAFKLLHADYCHAMAVPSDAKTLEKSNLLKDDAKVIEAAISEADKAFKAWETLPDRAAAAAAATLDDAFGTDAQKRRQAADSASASLTKMAKLLAEWRPNLASQSMQRYVDLQTEAARVRQRKLFDERQAREQTLSNVAPPAAGDLSAAGFDDIMSKAVGAGAVNGGAEGLKKIRAALKEVAANAGAKPPPPTQPLNSRTYGRDGRKADHDREEKLRGLSKELRRFAEDTPLPAPLSSYVVQLMADAADAAAQIDARRNATLIQLVSPASNRANFDKAVKLAVESGGVKSDTGARQISKALGKLDAQQEKLGRASETKDKAAAAAKLWALLDTIDAGIAKLSDRGQWSANTSAAAYLKKLSDFVADARKPVEPKIWAEVKAATKDLSDAISTAKKKEKVDKQTRDEARVMLRCLEAQRNLAGVMNGIDYTLGQISDDEARLIFKTFKNSEQHIKAAETSAAKLHCDAADAKILLKHVDRALEDFKARYAALIPDALIKEVKKLVVEDDDDSAQSAPKPAKS